MAIVPEFLIKRIYIPGSLRETSEGIAFDLVNYIGPGVLTKLNKIKLNYKEFTPKQILLKMGDRLLKAHEIDENNPAMCFHNQRVTCIVVGAKLAVGLQTITVDIFSREAGEVILKIQDHYTG